MIELISQNPYRTLGVYVNSTLKERLTNVNRFKAFDKVGKSVYTDVDFNEVLTIRPNRTIDNIERALQGLNLPIDQLKHAVFWFASTIPADEIALKNLADGKLEKARSIESKFSVWSSILNYHTISILTGDLKGAVTQELINKEYDVYNQFITNPTEDNFRAYMRDFREGTHIQEVTQKYVNTLKHQGPIALNDFADDYPVLSKEYDIHTLVNLQSDSLYKIATGLNTLQGWQKYQQSVPPSEFRDCQKIIEIFKNRDWNTDHKAWKQACTLGTLAGFYKYVTRYPNGSHYSTANKKIIDMEVDKVMAGDYGQLPSLDKTSYGYGSTSSISVYNNTSYTLTLLYSGPDSKRISISPHQRKALTLKNGSYRCVTSVSGTQVRNHAGSETLNGGCYEIEYYISSY